MTLKEKLHKIYEEIDLIEKRGRNEFQKYDYIRAADVTNAIRAQFIALKIYAQVEFDFVGTPYTIAREKSKDAPFSAVNVKCSITFHDLESTDTFTSSGLGTGADTGDKAAYKAETGALKYALKNAFLVPDAADPEADETVDERSQPAQRPQVPPAIRAHQAQQAQRQAQRPTQAPTRPTAAAQQTQAVRPAPQTAQSSGAKPMASPSPAPAAAPAPTATSTSSPAATSEPLPTEAEMTGYREKFRKMGIGLAEQGGLKASRGLPINRKTLIFLFEITKNKATETISKALWDDFFARVDKATANPGGWKTLAELVENANTPSAGKK
jgi:hypothetical protein